MPLLVDTSVWSLAFRRDRPPEMPEVDALRAALSGGDDVHTCGLILLETLRGVLPARARSSITESFASLYWVEPDRVDYAEAAELANTCRRNGVQLATVDALLAQLAIRRELTLLTTDRDFEHAAHHIPLRLWR